MEGDDGFESGMLLRDGSMLLLLRLANDVWCCCDTICDIFSFVCVSVYTGATKKDARNVYVAIPSRKLCIYE